MNSDLSKYTYNQRLIIVKRKYREKIVLYKVESLNSYGVLCAHKITDYDFYLLDVLYETLFSIGEKKNIIKILGMCTNNLKAYTRGLYSAIGFITKAEIEDIKSIIPEIVNEYKYYTFNIQDYFIYGSANRKTDKQLSEFLHNRKIHYITYKFTPAKRENIYKDLAKNAGIYFPPEFTEQEIEQYIKIMLKEDNDDR